MQVLDVVHDVIFGLEDDMIVIALLFFVVVSETVLGHGEDPLSTGHTTHFFLAFSSVMSTLASLLWTESSW